MITVHLRTQLADSTVSVKTIRELMPRRSAGPSTERWADPCRVDKDDDDEPQCRSRNLAFGVGPLPPWSDPCDAVSVTGNSITAWHLSLLSIVWSRRLDTLWREALGKKEQHSTECGGSQRQVS